MALSSSPSNLSGHSATSMRCTFFPACSQTSKTVADVSLRCSARAASAASLGLWASISISHMTRNSNVKPLTSLERGILERYVLRYRPGREACTQVTKQTDILRNRSPMVLAASNSLPSLVREREALVRIFLDALRPPPCRLEVRAGLAVVARDGDCLMGWSALIALGVIFSERDSADAARTTANGTRS
jgi:hypothetical protein